MPKDILVLMTDQHRADWVGAYGATWVRTPTLDRLASEGVIFTNCYTSAPVCMPARASFLTGTYPHNLGMWNNAGRIQDVEGSCLHPLRNAGYRTCHVGKSHLYTHPRGGDLRDEEPYMHSLGWDDILECTGPLNTQNTKSILTDWMEMEGIYEAFLDDYRRRAETPGWALWPSPLPDGKHMDDFIARTAVDYITSSDNSQPLYLFVGIGGPHEPWDPPARFDTYDPAAMPPPLPPDPAPKWLDGPALAHHQQVMGQGAQTTPEEWARMRSLYSARVEHVDYLMGQVLDAWEAARGRDSWVLFWSDHGDMLGDKSRTAKWVFYEPSVRVPAILRPPHSQKAAKCEGLVSTPDLTATLLDIAGCRDIGPNFFGTSVQPALNDPNAVGAEIVVSEVSDRIMIYDGHWKMVLNARDELLKLINTEEDPHECVNLAGKPGTEPEVNHLRDALRAFLLRTQYRQYREIDGR